jgi:hypothetical protein
MRHIGIAALLGCLAWTTPAAAQSSVKEFELGGSAAFLGDSCIRLTPDEPWLTGSAWYQNPIDLSQAFEMQLDIVLGEKDLDGADGIVFVFHPTKQTGFRGEGMGFAGLIPSLGIEFDTYQNTHLLDPAEDHLAAMRNGRSFHGDGVPPIGLGNLEDGKRHKLRIAWSPGAGSLDIHLDGELKTTIPGTVVKNTFDGTPMVYWGMTAATGRLSNAQDVCIEQLLLGARILPSAVRGG